MNPAGGYDGSVGKRYEVFAVAVVNKLVRLYRSGRSGTGFLYKERKPFELPKANESMRRIYGYLIKVRGIDKSVIKVLADKRMIYESEEYYNVVFVGYDKDGVHRHAHKRGSTQASAYRGNIDSCLPEYSFHWHGDSHEPDVFEAPIDMLSFITLNKDGWQ